MNRTMHEAAARSSYEQAVLDNPEWARLVVTTRVRLRQGWYRPWSDIFHQGTWHDEQLFMFAQLYSALLVQKILVVEIEVGMTPHSDASVAQNHEALQHLGAPFTGTFLGGPGDGDGQLQWSAPIRVASVQTKKMQSAERKSPTEVSLQAGSAVLEVGSTKASRTMLHLREGHLLARWPYESKSLYLLHWVGADDEDSATPLST